jgi:hypothetical protein
MPVEITWTASGVWAWLAAHPEAVKRQKIRAVVRAAQKQAFEEWCGIRVGMVGLGARFTANAFNLLRLTPRSTGYQARQRKVLGRVLPYVSPTKTSGTMERLTLGGGWNVTNRNGTDDVTTVMAITGARQLNLLREPFGPIYRKEFLGFKDGGARDAVWIRRRAEVLMHAELVAEMKRAQRRTLRAGEVAA